MPPKNLNERRTVRKIDQAVIRTGGDWDKTTSATLGNNLGVVDTGMPGMVYARLRTGEPIEVYNDVAPSDLGIKVLIGRRKDTPTLWRVITWRNTHSTPQIEQRVKYHGKQHGFREPDETPINRKQILQLTIIVKDAGAFTVQVYGGQATTIMGLVRVNNKVLDLSSYIPATGAVYVLIQFDQDGVVTAVPGVGFASPEISTPANVPYPVAGSHQIGHVLLFEGMELLLDKYIYVPIPVLTDYVAIGTGAQIHAAGAETTLANGDEIGFWQDASGLLKKITWEHLLLLLNDLIEPPRLVMATGVTHPPVPVENAEGDDWIYSTD